MFKKYFKRKVPGSILETVVSIAIIIAMIIIGLDLITKKITNNIKNSNSTIEIIKKSLQDNLGNSLNES